MLSDGKSSAMQTTLREPRPGSSVQTLVLAKADNAGAGINLNGGQRITLLATGILIQRTLP